MENIAYDLASYADISRVVKDPEYAKSKCLCVKHQPQIYSNQADKLHSLYVIKYDKQCLNAANYHTLGLWRSVVTDGNRVLSFAPPKSLPITMFEEGLECYEYCLVEEFVEGTMMNLFNVDGEWETCSITPTLVIGRSLHAVALVHAVDSTKSLVKRLGRCLWRP